MDNTNLSGIKSDEKAFSLYKRLLKTVKHLWPLLLIAASGSVFYSAADSSAIYLIKPLLNNGFQDGGITAQSATKLKGIGIILLILFSIRGIGSFISSFFMGKLGQKVVYKFRKDLYERLLNLPAYFFDKYSSGKILSRILYNVDQVTGATASAIVTIVQDGTFVIGLLVVMFISSWQLSLVMILITPILAVFITFVSKKFRTLSRNTQGSMGIISHFSEETIRNYKEIRIFGSQDEQYKKFKHSLDFTYSQQIKTIFLDSITSPIVQVVAAVMLACVLFLVATFGIGTDSSDSWLSAGSFITFFASSLAILKPIKNLTKVNIVIQRAVAATEDIFFILDFTYEQDNGTKKLEKAKGKIQFKDLFFSYASDDILKNINLDIDAGKTIALVGKSGSGKTTLVNLVARFYNPTQGIILLDDEDISKLTLANLRSHISMVSQNVNLFDDTIYNNITCGIDREVSEEKVINALKKANAWEFVKPLKNGIHSSIGQNGSNLSGGQRQRVAIARALIKDSAILIFDEATSALDNKSEKSIQDALENIAKTRTTFIIAHRLTTVENADIIVVMDEGKILEKGSHAELIDKKELYYNLYNSSLL